MASTSTSPSAPASTVSLSPHILTGWPGPTHASQQKTRELIEKNHFSHHIFEKNNIFHNHLSHHILTAFSLGASPEVLSSIYDDEAKTLVPLEPEERRKQGAKVREVPEIDEANWKDYLGVQDAYASYLSFFQNELARLGTAGALDKYLFSDDANGGGLANAKGPRMLLRTVAGVLHPLIQLGFGAEFSDAHLLAEGLAETAVHDAKNVAAAFPDNWPHNSDSSDPLAGFVAGSSAISNLASTLSNLTTTATSSSSSSKPEGALTAIEVYAQLCASKTITMPPYDADAMINKRLADALAHGNALELRGLVARWDFELGKEGWEKKHAEELMLFGALIAGGTGRRGKKTMVDFFLMHILTSSLLLPSILAHLPSDAHKSVFLKTYLVAACHTALARGRPHIDVGLIMGHSASPAPPPSRETKGGEKIGRGDVANPWCALIEASLHEPDSHTPKSLRTLLHLASLPDFSLAPAGSLPFATSSSSPSLPEVDRLDGSVFVRIAGMIMDQQAGWGDGKGERRDWGRIAPGWDKAWEGVE